MFRKMIIYPLPSETSRIVSALTLPVFYLWNRYIGKVKYEGPPCFIVGCGSSGKTILLRILGAHSQLHAIPYESHVGTHPNTKRILKWFDFLAVAHGKPRWVEKTAKNIYNIEKLLTCRPGAKVIIVIRDGRDVAASIKRRSGSLEKGIRRWTEDNNAGQPYWNDINVMVLHYESLIEDFEGCIARLLSFLGEAYEQGCRNYHKKKVYYYRRKSGLFNSSNVQHLRFHYWQINQPIFNGKGRWKELSRQEVELVKKRLGPKLIEYGYVDSNDW